MSAAPGQTPQRRLFDGHCRIIDHRFPIVVNLGYVPPNFLLDAYLAEVKPLEALGPDLAQKAFWDNPLALYRVTPRS